jgi:hypothetical protein
MRLTQLFLCSEHVPNLTTVSLNMTSAWMYSSDVLDAFRSHAAFVGKLPLLRTVAKLFTSVTTPSSESVKPLLPALVAMAADASEAGRRARVSMMACDVVAHIVTLWGSLHGARARPAADAASAAAIPTAFPSAAEVAPAPNGIRGFAKGTGYGSGACSDAKVSVDDYVRRMQEKHATSILCLEVLRYMAANAVRSRVTLVWCTRPRSCLTQCAGCGWRRHLGC